MSASDDDSHAPLSPRVPPELYCEQARALLFQAERILDALERAGRLPEGSPGHACLHNDLQGAIALLLHEPGAGELAPRGAKLGSARHAPPTLRLVPRRS